MTPLEIDEVLDRLCGEFEYRMSDDERGIWASSIKAFDRDQAMMSVKTMLDSEHFPTIATFRLECIRQGQKSRPKGRCGCLDGWELPTEDNYVVACRQCPEGELKAACVEVYRAARADWRRRHRTPEFLKEKVATPEAAHSWADQARDWLVNGMPEPEPVPAGSYYNHDEEF